MRDKETEEKKGRVLFLAAIIGCGVIFILANILTLSEKWALSTWANLEVEEIIYHLKAPLQGTGGGMIKKYVLSCLVPVAAMLAVYIGVLVAARKKRKAQYIFAGVITLVSCIICGFSLKEFWDELNISEYIKNQSQVSEFINSAYVDPRDVDIEFPEEKRNLIMIFMESGEITFTDKENGGAFDNNVIPELTKIAQENENFSGSDTKLNGGYVLPYSTWTMAGIFSQTTGVPLQITIGINSMDTQESFCPNVYALGDMLEAEGYNQAFLCGSDSTFGGRKLYFQGHGDFDILDYPYAIEQEWIPADYNSNWWGYEDDKLFEFAKNTITEMAAENAPFNLTMLTVDTHFEDGYECEDCPDTFGDDQYSNAYACSSIKINEFVEWIQAQDFYENTTVVIVGDHLTMDSDYCDNVSDDYERKTFVAYINPGCENQDTETYRQYSTLDIFPTVVAALGATIEGNRLGLGTNLFSGELTLVEEYGLKYISSEIKKRSEIMDYLISVDTESEKYMKMEGIYPDALVYAEYDQENKVMSFSVSDIENLPEDVSVKSVQLEIYPFERPENARFFEFAKDGDETYTLNADLSYIDTDYQKMFVILNTSDGKQYTIEQYSCDLTLFTNDIYEYLTVLKEKENYMIILAAMDEASVGVDERLEKMLYDIGIAIDFTDEDLYKGSYYAIVVPGEETIVQTSPDKLIYSGTMPDGETTLKIMSSGANTGSGCSIEIGGNEVATRRRGMNFVIVDLTTGEVVDSVRFDAYVDELTASRDKRVSADR